MGDAGLTAGLICWTMGGRWLGWRNRGGLAAAVSIRMAAASVRLARRPAMILTSISGGCGDSPGLLGDVA